MITEARKLAFQKLIDETPIYIPESSKKVPVTETIMVVDDLPSTLATEFYKQSKVKFKYNRFDGFSIWHNNKYQRVEDTTEIQLHIRKFLIKCVVEKQKKQGDAWIKHEEKLKKQTTGFV